MIKQLLFGLSLLITLGVFAWTIRRLYSFLKLTKPFPIGDYGKRFAMMMEVAIGQTKIFRFPVVGLLHALVFWGFLVILIGSIEMIVDGLFGTERIFGGLGLFYDIIVGSGDVFAFIIAIAILIFLGRRLFLNVKRFNGIEMKHVSHLDANIALTMILLLMLSLLGMNIYYYILHPDNALGYYPVSMYVVSHFLPQHFMDFHAAHMQA